MITPSTVNIFPESTATVGQFRLLFVDDNGTLCHLAKIGFEKLNVTTVIARDGFEAQQLIRNSQQPFDIVITDVQMPTMDGITFLKWFRKDENRIGVPVIVCASNEILAKKATEAGASSVFLKPVEWRQLAHQVMQHVGA